MAPGQPVLLVSADRRNAWRLRDGRLVAGTMSPAHDVEHGVEALVAEVGDLSDASTSISRYVAIPIPQSVGTAATA
ncbi:hypothetical protein [Tsuneonella amylolytica]|uniref:hypothetical protein n=1 Tax=Tsuneonella amylolytica TaxID=2338327 RepID=UPI0013C51324|nr:hypothetical protein [Tsuneonella amylolytica]